MPIKHGTNRGYAFYACRCDECREAHRLAAARDRERNAERVNATKRQWYVANAESVQEGNRRWRDANIEHVHEYDRMRYQRDRERQLELRRASYLLNRQAYIDKAKRWKVANPEKSKESARKTRERPEQKEAARKRSADRYQNDPEYRERSRERFREWAKTPQGRLYFRAQREARRGVPYTPEALEWIASLVDPLCTYCGEPATSIDHIVAVTKGGSGELDNLTPACRPCNSKKRNLSVESFLARLEKEK